MKNNNEITVDVQGCSRCGRDHIGLTFRRMLPESRRALGCTHCALCPIDDEPIYLRVVGDGKLPKVVSILGGFAVGASIAFYIAGWPGVLGTALVYAVYQVVWSDRGSK